MRLDLGDVVAHFNLEVPGLRRWHFRWHVGRPRDVTEADRTPSTPGTARPTHRKVDVIMDLMADQAVDLSLEWTDEAGNPTTAPTDTGAASFSASDPSIIALTDNGDGTAVAAATGTLGSSDVNVSVVAGGRTLTGTLNLVVVAGLAERINVVAGTPREATPDETA